MRSRALVFCGFTAIAVTLALPPAAAFAAKPPSAPVTDAPVSIRCDDSLTVLRGRQVTLPFDVTDAAYDSTTRTLYASCHTIETAATSINSLEASTQIVRRQFIAYSLDQRAIVRQVPSDWRPVHAFGRQLLARNDHDVAILDAASGDVLCQASNGELLIADDSLFVLRSGDDVVRLETGSGAQLWRRNLGLANRASLAVANSGSLFVVGDGVAALGQADGAGWEYEAATQRSDVASRITTGVLAVAASIVALRFNVPDYWGVRLDDLCSLPLVQGDHVYFAADTLVMSLRRDNGLAQWTKRLGSDSFGQIRMRATPTAGRPAQPELPGHLLVRDGGASLAVITTGYAPNGNRVWRADPPSIALLDPTTGETRARLRIGDATSSTTMVATDYRHVQRGHLVMTPRKLLLYDDALKTLATLAPPVGARVFEYFVKDSARLLVRTNAGLLALDADSLTVRWERRLGGGVSEAHGPSLDGRSWWIGHSGIVAIPATDAHAPLGATLRSAQAHIDSGYAVALDGRSVTVIALPGAREE